MTDFKAIRTSFEALLRGDTFNAKLINDFSFWRGVPAVIDKNGCLTDFAIEMCMVSETAISHDYVFYWKPEPALINALVSALDNGLIVNCNNSKIRRLINLFRLAEKDNYLTERGYHKAITYLPLLRQCELLDIPFATIKLKRKNKEAAKDALEYYRSLGWEGFHDEGAMYHILMESLYYKVRNKLQPETIKEYAERLFIDSKREPYDTSIERCTEAIKSCWKFRLDELIFGLEKGIMRSKSTEEKKEILIRAINESSGRGIKKNYIEMKNKLDGEEDNPAEKEFIAKLYSNIGVTNIIEIEKAISFCSQPASWPDLTLIRKNEFKLIEVKDKDKLMYYQIRTIARLRKILKDEEIGVTKLGA